MSDDKQTPSSSIRIMVVDDQELICEGIASLLSLQPGITVVGTAGDGRAAVEMAIELKPDVVLMDVRMPVMDGLDAASRIRRRLPLCRVIMLTTFADEQYVIRSLRADTHGYLLKDRPARELAEAIRLVHAGVAQFDATAIARVTAALDKADVSGTNSVDIALTTREIEVLRLIATGATNKEIADQLRVSEGTIKNHVSRIFSRLGLRDRTNAAIYARNQGII